MEWSGQKDFVASPEIPFEVDGSEAGVLKTNGPLSFLKVSLSLSFLSSHLSLFLFVWLLVLLFAVLNS